jgi:hypothetical protein
MIYLEAVLLLKKLDRAYLSRGQTSRTNKYPDQPGPTTTIANGIEGLTIPGLEPPIDAVVVESMVAYTPSDGTVACTP